MLYDDAAEKFARHHSPTEQSLETKSARRGEDENPKLAEGIFRRSRKLYSEFLLSHYKFQDQMINFM